MNIVITGASSGIGRDMARVFSADEDNVIYAVARRADRLNELSRDVNCRLVPLVHDLGNREECIALYNELADEDIDIFINNAGFGLCGKFDETPLERELDMIDTNIIAVHILTKLFYSKFRAAGKGRILNVASSAGFMMGPFLSTYYATKAYVLRLSEAVNREAVEDKSPVRVSVLCPGPVRTEFDTVADVKFSLSGLSSEYVARYAIKKLMKGKTLIVPGISIKLLLFFARLVPDKLLSKITYHVQRKKTS